MNLIVHNFKEKLYTVFFPFFICSLSCHVLFESIFYYINKHFQFGAYSIL